ncbi:gliding motility-associated C-terminal domain-containing protein [Salegentibacter echinorum]|uniref:Gliding motility-associated C-terminal domain-containing protein n=1 Tax=Salegentibacter echinorum TaxID=1073325 RepID=A0A1M5KEB6_SALEC|nr:gliding motility-associated C-terminal domain-containing protein [Salegentibacter echinorum]SHG51087.1 gliding motility-associated C-terminal domain-containing protein [Salegentibacter echinorum]
MKKKILYIAILLLSTGLHAQTSNEGTLYVSEDTEFSTLERFNNLETGNFFNDGNTFIYNHFNNDGVIDFYNETGLTQFIGSNPQRISGGNASYFYNVLFENNSENAPFQLSGEINIAGESNFSQGIVDNDNYGGNIIFEEKAHHINTSNASHVDGYVIHYGTEDFIFPVGDQSFYRFAGTAEIQNTSSIVEAKYYLENSNEMYSQESRSDIIQVINKNEYWTIENIGETEEAFITLSWSDETTPPEILATPREETIHIVRWDETENRWIDEGGIVNSDNQTVSTMVNNFGIFTLARVDEGESLPCQISVYNAVTPNGDGVNDYFSINSESCIENISVEIYNRWGVKVFETNNYGKQGDLFDGYSRGRLTVNKDEQLPTGTYFYILKFDYESSTNKLETYKKAGYLYLNGN